MIEERLRAADAVPVVRPDEAVMSQWVRAGADIVREAKRLAQLSLDGLPPPTPFNRIRCAELAGWASDLDAPGWRTIVASVDELAGRPGRAHSQS